LKRGADRVEGSLVKKLVLIVLCAVSIGLLSAYPFEVLGMLIGVLLLWLPVHLAGLIGRCVGACVDAEIERRQRQDQLIRRLLQISERERFR
jgi:hypothetical protein